MLIEVKKGEILSLEQNGAGWGIKTLEGTLWLTSSEDLRDFLLKASDSHVRFEDGKILIEALSDKARFEISKHG